MVPGRVMSAAGCSQCRASILRLFLGSATPLVRSPLTTSASWRTVVPAGKSARPYATASHSDGATASKDPHHAASSTDNLEAASEEQASDQTPSTTQADEPWYLQVEPPRHVPVSEPPPLPDVPEGSPAVIPQLLKYAAEEMGLDDLKLLDLRELDPPPALGTNLFMLFGTARSERHLNVSAGRLVRWLRAQHRIYADADGLLGPNERKTKLRRKAKRARLLGTMGTDDADDGITTGWICVNLGTINRSHMESAVVGEDGRVAGFGVPQTGSTIVVQVLTESRRSELGLETLWERHLAQQSKKHMKELESGKDVDSQTPENPALSHAPSRPTMGTSPSTTSPFSGQTRSYSTQTTYVDSRHNVPTTSQVDELHAFLTGSIGSNEATRQGSDEAAGLQAAALFSESLSHDSAAKTRMIELLNMHLQNLPRNQIFATFKTTPFLKVSEVAMHDMPADKTWALRLSIQAKARQLGFEGYKSLGLHKYGNLDGTRELIDQLRIFALPATREEMQQLLSCIYNSPESGLDEQNSLAMELLESVHMRGESVIQNDVVVAIVEGISWSPKRNTQTHDLLRRLDDFIVQAELPYMGEPLLIRLMEAYARLKRWDSFWETWRTPARYAQPRSKTMYLHFFEAGAATKDRSSCSQVLRQGFQDMFMEDPVVEPVGQIYEAILQCIRVADPKAELHAATIPDHAIGIAQALSQREFVKMIKDLQILQANHPRSQSF